MKNGFAIFLGAFFTLALSWAGVLLTAHHQFGRLGQFKDPVDESLNPAALTGLADRGRLVYRTSAASAATRSRCAAKASAQTSTASGARARVWRATTSVSTPSSSASLASALTCATSLCAAMPTPSIS